MQFHLVVRCDGDSHTEDRVLLTNPFISNGKRILLTGSDGWPRIEAARWVSSDFTKALALPPNGKEYVIETGELPTEAMRVLAAQADANESRSVAEKWLQELIGPRVKEWKDEMIATMGEN